MKKLFRTFASPYISWCEVKTKAKRIANEIKEKEELDRDKLALDILYGMVYTTLSFAFDGLNRNLYADGSNYGKSFTIELNWQNQLDDSRVIIEVYEEVENNATTT